MNEFFSRIQLPSTAGQQLVYQRRVRLLKIQRQLDGFPDNDADDDRKKDFQGNQIRKAVIPYTTLQDNSGLSFQKQLKSQNIFNRRALFLKLEKQKTDLL